MELAEVGHNAGVTNGLTNTIVFDVVDCFKCCRITESDSKTVAVSVFGLFGFDDESIVCLFVE